MAKIRLNPTRSPPFGGIFPSWRRFLSFWSLPSTIRLACGANLWLPVRRDPADIGLRPFLRRLLRGGCHKTSDATLSLHPTLRTCSSDTILRAIKELSEDSIQYTSESGKSYRFNAAERMNNLLLDCLLASGQLEAGESYDMDFDHQLIGTEKYDMMPRTLASISKVMVRA